MCAFTWRVEPIPIRITNSTNNKVEIRTEYFLYYGSDYHKMLETVFFKNITWVTVWNEDGRYVATARIPKIGYLPIRALHTTWMPEYSGSVLGGLPKAIGVFSSLPDEMRRLFYVFPDVFYVALAVDFGTMRVYFDLSHKEDYFFYEKKLLMISPEV